MAAVISAAEAAYLIPPRERGWLIIHPMFPEGMKHFCCDNRRPPKSTILLFLPELDCAIVPLTIEQAPTHEWTVDRGDATGRALWKCGEGLAYYCCSSRARIRNFRAGRQQEDTASISSSSSSSSSFSSASSSSAGLSAAGTEAGNSENSTVTGSDRHGIAAGTGTGGGQRRVRVVELGSGACAVPSLAAGVCGFDVIASDMASMLPELQRNIDVNREAIAREMRMPFQVRARELLWGEPIPPDVAGDEVGPVDLVLAADVLYTLPGKPFLGPLLVRTLQSLCDRGTLVLFAYQLRCGLERTFFEDMLPRGGFCCRDKTQEFLHLPMLGVAGVGGSDERRWNEGGNVRIVEVTLAS